MIVALASIAVYPDLQSLSTAFPNVEKVDHDIAYSAMLTFLPHGLLGLVITSLIAAYMSTISTHLNWGSSYLVHDFYKRFVKPESSEKELVNVGRISTVLLMVFAGILALFLESALDSFNILLQIGAGTGLIFILRWFWWRINAAGEIAAMIISFVIALFFQFGYESTGLPDLKSWQELVLAVLLTTIGWLVVVFITKPTDDETLFNFVELAKAGGKGWDKVVQKAQMQERTLAANDGEKWKVPQGIFAMILGSVTIYSLLMATGHWIYGNTDWALGLTAIGGICAYWLSRKWVY
jgi:Na+/proline symporter